MIQSLKNWKGECWMDKAGGKCRDIKFRSEKNGKVVCVHSEAARAYARVLEADENVVSYEAGFILDREKYQYIDTLDIRKEYFDTVWAFDFVIYYVDGKFGIREIVSEAMLEKRANIEKLEFSRRYWAVSGAADWKLVIMEKSTDYRGSELEKGE